MSVKRVETLGEIQRWLFDNDLFSFNVISKENVPQESLDNGGDANIYICANSQTEDNVDEIEVEKETLAIEIFNKFLAGDKEVTKYVTEDDNLVLIDSGWFVTSNIDDCRNLENPDLIVVDGYLYDLWYEKVFSKEQFERLKEKFNSDDLDYDDYDYEEILAMIK